MRLTLHTDYALRVLIFVAIADGKLITISDIAESFDISKQHLMKVVNDHSQKGYVKRTTRGVSARRWSCCGSTELAAHLDTFGVPLTSPVKSAQFERISDQRMNWIPVLNVEEIDPSTEYLRLVVFPGVPDAAPIYLQSEKGPASQRDWRNVEGQRAPNQRYFPWAVRDQTGAEPERRPWSLAAWFRRLQFARALGIDCCDDLDSPNTIADYPSSERRIRRRRIDARARSAFDPVFYRRLA
jgi:hypothetical protein